MVSSGEFHLHGGTTMQALSLRLLATSGFMLTVSGLFGEDVNNVLKRWDEHVSAHPRTGTHGTARLFTYDSIFQIETRRRVEFWTSGPDRWRIEFMPEDLTGKESRRPGRDGSAFQLQTTKNCERWVRVGPSFIHKVGLRDQSPTTWEHTLNLSSAPETRSLWERLADWPTICAEDFAVPLLLCESGLGSQPGPDGVPTDNWLIELGNLNGKDKRIHLVLHSKERHERARPQYEILLKADDFAPVAIRVIDPAHTYESVYAFEKVEDLPGDAAVFNVDAIQAWPPGTIKNR
jgi:hypothetical protein